MEEEVARLLWSIVRESGDPMVLVGSDRRVLAATRSFQELVGVKSFKELNMTCDQIVRLEAGESWQPFCCLDSLKRRFSGGNFHIWTIQRVNGAGVPVLCRIYPVRLNKENIGAVVYVSPLRADLLDGERLLSQLLLASLRFLRDQMSNNARYLAWLTRWIKKLSSLSFVCWLRLTGPGQMVCEYSEGKLPPGITLATVETSLGGIGDLAQREVPFDYWIKGGAGSFVHVFPSPGGYGSKLFLVLIGGDLDPWRVKWLCHIAQTVNAAPDPAPRVAGDDRYLTLLVSTGLSPREKEIASMIAAGYTDREIASRLYLSVHTVKNHVRRIMAKLNVHKRTQIIAALSGFPRSLSH